MKITRRAEHQDFIEDIAVPSFGYELIREELLNTLLGKDSPEILYWAGKTLARTYPLKNINEITAFFLEAGWGNLLIKKESKGEAHFELTGPLISNRIQLNKATHYKLEAGFLAQQLETQNGMVAEATDNIHKRSSTVEIIVKWDKTDAI